MMAHRQPMRDRKEPRAERARLVVSMQPFKGAHECFLEQVLGIGAASDLSLQEPQESNLKPSGKHAERIATPTTGAAGKLLVALSRAEAMWMN
jgi:hypothetical protein